MGLKVLVPLPLFTNDPPPKFEVCRVNISGKWRVVHKPNKAMRVLHKDLTFVLYRHLNTLDISSTTGSLPESSAMRNALRHTSGKYFYVFDIKNAYPSVPLDRLARVLRKMSREYEYGSVKEIESFLRTYCAGEDGGLAVGAPASPFLFNIYGASEVDPGIRKILKKSGDIYTRYIDDLVISSQKPIPRILRKRIREVITNAGLQVNHKKSQVLDIATGPVTITGVTITDRGFLGPTNKFIQKVQNILWLSPEEYTKGDYWSTLQGFIGYLQSFTNLPPEQVSPLAQSLLKNCKKRLEKDPEWQRREQEKQEWLSAYKKLIDYIAKTIPLEDVVGRRVKLIKKGRHFVGLCPFHKEKSPSFTIPEKEAFSDEKRFYHCFGCGSNGSVIDFLMKTEEVSFHKAVREIANKYELYFPEKRKGNLKQ